MHSWKHEFLYTSSNNKWISFLHCLLWQEIHRYAQIHCWLCNWRGAFSRDPLILAYFMMIEWMVLFAAAIFGKLLLVNK